MAEAIICGERRSSAPHHVRSLRPAPVFPVQCPLRVTESTCESLGLSDLITTVAPPRTGGPRDRACTRVRAQAAQPGLATDEWLPWRGMPRCCRCPGVTRGPAAAAVQCAHGGVRWRGARSAHPSPRCRPRQSRRWLCPRSGPSSHSPIPAPPGPAPPAPRTPSACAGGSRSPAAMGPAPPARAPPIPPASSPPRCRAARAPAHALRTRTPPRHDGAIPPPRPPALH